MASPTTAAVLLLADKRVAVTLWAKVHSVLNFLQVGNSEVCIDKNLICFRKPINILVEKMVSDSQWYFFSVLFGTLHFGPSVLFCFVLF